MDIYILYYLIAGSFAGVLAGLFGIGGGLIMVPFLFYIFESLNIDPAYLMHLAVGTSFAIIIPTSFVSVMTHLKFDAVDKELVKVLDSWQSSV